MLVYVGKEEPRVFLDFGIREMALIALEFCLAVLSHDSVGNAERILSSWRCS